MSKKQLFVSFLAVPLLTQAQNPVIRDQFAADPTARVFNNKDSDRTGSAWPTITCSHLRI